jgi:hypothetical protein
MSVSVYGKNSCLLATVADGPPNSHTATWDVRIVKKDPRSQSTFRSPTTPYVPDEQGVNLFAPLAYI